ncbi:MAG: type II secretion system F family protein [Actinomycetota bacterium]
MSAAAVFAGFTAVLAVAAVAVRGAPLRAVAAIGAPGVATPSGAGVSGASGSGGWTSGVRTPTGIGPRPADELPLLLDLLATATAAGMSGTVAFGAAATALRGPLGASLRAVAAAASLGGPLPDGIRGAANDLDLPDLGRAASILERSGSLGVPVAVALGELAEEHRRARRRAAEQRARTAPVRMLFPLVFLVLPAFLLLTVVPMLLATLGSLG